MWNCKKNQASLFVRQSLIFLLNKYLLDVRILLVTPVFSGCKKTPCFWIFDKKPSKTRLSKFLKPRSLLIVNDCFKNENNAVFGVFLQRLNKIRMYFIASIILYDTKMQHEEEV
mgnify:CR=1 FL=1